MRALKDCWVCEICTFTWPVNGDETPPTHCKNSKCRRRTWHTKTAATASTHQVASAAPTPPLVIASVQALPAMSRDDSARPFRSFPKGGKASSLHTESPSSQPAVKDGKLTRRVVADIIGIKRPGVMCPHGWASAFICPTCSPQR